MDLSDLSPLMLPPERFPLLEQECAATEAKPQRPFVAGLCWHQDKIKRTAPCELCCRWSFPLAIKEHQSEPFLIARAYEEWIVWHLHVLNHQHLEPSASVGSLA